jgi:hypothetical protein
VLVADAEQAADVPNREPALAERTHRAIGRLASLPLGIVQARASRARLGDGRIRPLVETRRDRTSISSSGMSRTSAMASLAASSA